MNYSKKRFHSDIDSFVNYVALCLNEKDDVHLYLERKNNVIEYGRYTSSNKRKENHLVKMVSNEDLYRFCEALQETFYDDISYRSNDVTKERESMTTFIGEHLKIDTTTDNSSDYSWIYGKTHKKGKTLIKK